MMGLLSFFVLYFLFKTFLYLFYFHKKGKDTAS